MTIGFFLNYFPMKPPVVCQPLCKFCRFTWVRFWKICFKNFIISSPIWKKSSQVGTLPNFYCLHQSWIPLLFIKNFFYKPKKHHFLLQSLLLHHFHFTLVLLAHLGYANIDFNQSSIFTDCCFKLWKRFEW